MTREEEIWYERRRELLQMIREAGISTDSHPMHALQAYPEQFDRFAAMVAATEREACARLVEPSEEHRRDASWGYIGGNEGVELLDSCAAAIRARGEV